MKKNIIVSLVFNALIVVLVCFATFCSIFNFNFMTGSGPIRFKPDFTIFKYFTTDSNIFVGIICAIMMGFEIAAIAKKDYELPKAVYIFKLISTACVGLTMLVTVCYLAPRDPKGYTNKFLDSNFFFHLIVPVLAIISFICFEKTNKLSSKTPLLSMIPVGIYTLYYTINTFVHMENGKVPSIHDLYGFFDAGTTIAIIVIPLMIFVTYIISLILWFSNKRDL